MSQYMLMWKTFPHKNSQKKPEKQKKGLMPGKYLMEMSMSLQSNAEMDDLDSIVLFIIPFIYDSRLSIIKNGAYVQFK